MGACQTVERSYPSIENKVIIGPGGVQEWEVMLAASEIIRVAGVAAYHTSVVVGGLEFCFDGAGIIVGPPLLTHTADGKPGPKTQVRKIGRTRLNGRRLQNILGPSFAPGSYDLLRKNCNTFADAALFLLTGTRLDGRFNRAERMLRAAEPLSLQVLHKLLRATGQADTGRRTTSALDCVLKYAGNPRAEGFCIEELINEIRLHFGVGDEAEADGSPRLVKLASCGFAHEWCAPVKEKRTRALPVAKVW